MLYFVVINQLIVIKLLIDLYFTDLCLQISCTVETPSGPETVTAWRGVRLRDMSAYGRCPLMGRVRPQEVSAYGTCPPTGGVRQRRFDCNVMYVGMAYKRTNK